MLRVCTDTSHKTNSAALVNCSFKLWRHPRKEQELSAIVTAGRLKKHKTIKAHQKQKLIGKVGEKDDDNELYR